MDRKRLVFVILIFFLVLQVLMRRRSHQTQVREATGDNRTPRQFSTQKESPCLIHNVVSRFPRAADTTKVPGKIYQQEGEKRRKHHVVSEG